MCSLCATGALASGDAVIAAGLTALAVGAKAKNAVLGRLRRGEPAPGDELDAPAGDPETAPAG